MRRQQTARARAHGGEAMAGAAAVSHSDRNARTTRVLRGPGPIPQKKASKQRGGMAMTPRLDFYGFSPAAALSAAVCLEPVGRWWCSPIGSLFFCVQDRRKTEGEGGGGPMLTNVCGYLCGGPSISLSMCSTGNDLRFLAGTPGLGAHTSLSLGRGTIPLC